MTETSGLNETHFRALFEQTNDGVFIISLDLEYLAVNQQGADMLGYEVEELVGMSVNEVIALEQRTGRFPGSMVGASTDQPVYERILQRKDGSTFPVEISTSIVYDPEGRPLHIQSIVRDITERVKLEQMKSDFINRASHELRTPLTTAILMTDLLGEECSEAEKKEYMDILISELNRQKMLIDSFLVAGRLESNMLIVHQSPVDLPPVLENAIASLKPLAKKKNITIHLAYQEPLPKVIGEITALQQIIINLVNNAIKFSPEGSQVSVRVEVYPEEVEILISDQGMGIPKEDLPNLFERFFRARNVTLAEIPGSGVGLYIVKSIVEELGGKLSVTSEEGQGTTFIVSLLIPK